jgi:YD repeat-containing protein
MPDGSTLSYQYDAAHRLTEVSDSLGNVTQYTLDAMGNRIKEDTFDPADRLTRTRRRVFDALSRLYNDMGADGQKSTFGYDGNGNLKSSTDALGRSSATTYDQLNRMATLTDAAGGIVRYGYDAKDRLASVKDPIALTTSYTYDGLGNLVQLASPDTGITSYTADAAGNTVGSTDARGLAASYAYDALNRQIARNVFRRERRLRVRQCCHPRFLSERTPHEGDRWFRKHELSIRCVRSRIAENADSRLRLLRQRRS